MIAARRTSLDAHGRSGAAAAVGRRRARPGRRRRVKIGLLATLEGPFAARRPGRHARRRAGAEAAATAWPAARRSRSSRPRPTPSPTWRSTPRASWSSRTRSTIMVGPLSGDEGIAVKDYAKTQPNITFINGSSGAQATTLVDPSPNFFRFNTEGAQWMVGPRRARARQGLQEDGPDRRGLRLPVLAGAGLHGRATASGGKVSTRPGCRSAARTTPR